MQDFEYTPPPPGIENVPPRTSATVHSPGVARNLVCVRRCPICQCYILQGSTSVYSRKVEHVHQLVLRTIDFLMQQKHQNGGGGGGGGGSKGSTGDDDMKEGEDVSAMREPWCSSLCD